MPSESSSQQKLSQLSDHNQGKSSAIVKEGKETSRVGKWFSNELNGVQEAASSILVAPTLNRMNPWFVRFFLFFLQILWTLDFPHQKRRIK